MKTLGIIVLLLAVVAAGVYVATKFFGKFKDEDKNGIPDVIEDKVEDIKEFVEDAKEEVEEVIEKGKAVAKEVKARAKRVKEEVKDVTDALKDVAAQSKDVVSAAKGGARKGRKPAANKTETIKKDTK
jgi:F0F1-type ATP synthase membrane subunit b/b'